MMQKNETKKKRYSRVGVGDRIFYISAMTIMAVLAAVVVIPLTNVIAASFSSATAVNAGKVLLAPVEFTLENYETILKYESVWLGYRNTIIYTICGTLISVFLTLICAFPLSQKRFSGRRFVNKLLMFTMVFSGGMIPTYILVRDLKLLNTIWAVLLPGAINFYNVIIVRNFIETTIPEELEESARMDGCSSFRYFLSFVLPLSKPIIAVVAMYYAVGQWNDYFNAFLYLSEKNLYPLQLFLRDILLSSKFDSSIAADPEVAASVQGLAETLKYVIIVVSTAPLMCIYPFVQKHFVKGVMIGSVKG